MTVTAGRAATVTAAAMGIGSGVPICSECVETAWAATVKHFGREPAASFSPVIFKNR